MAFSFMMNKDLLKVFCLLFCYVLLIPGLAGADLISDLKLPSQIGSVKETYLSPTGSGKSIIQIQDAHCNYEAQKNLSRILEYLIKEQKVTLVLVEGGSGDVSLSFLRSYSDKKTREEVAEKYLRMGKISGEEYLNIVSELDFKLYGIEDENLYESNLDSFLGFESYRELGLKDLEKLFYIVETLKRNVYNPDLTAFEARHNDYNAKKLSLSGYCEYLKQTAEKKGWNFRSEYPALASFLERAETEKGVDLKRAEEQRNVLIKELAKMMDERGVRELIAKTQELKDRKISTFDYYTFLKGAAQRNRIDLTRQYPELDAYIAYAGQGKAINTGDFIRDAAALKDRITESLFRTNDERMLDTISRSIELLTKFVKLELTPEEYTEFARHGSELRTSAWINFLSDKCRGYGLSERAAASSVIDDNFAKLEAFYKVGMEREQAFFRNIEQRMREARADSAVVITGGFHTGGISRMLKDRGYSYSVVTPAITKKGDSEVYFSVLRGERSKPDEFYSEDEE